MIINFFGLVESSSFFNSNTEALTGASTGTISDIQKFSLFANAFLNPAPSLPAQTKSGIALLYNEETNNTYDVCLKLTRDALTIQKLDVVCTSGGETQVNVSAPDGSRRSSEFTACNSHSTVSMSNIFLPIRNSHLLKHRTVTLRRQANGGLGLSIKVSTSKKNMNMYISDMEEEESEHVEGFDFVFFQEEHHNASFLPFREVQSTTFL